MSQFTSLLGIQLKMLLGLSTLRAARRTDRNKFYKTAAIYLVVLFAIVYLLYFYIRLLNLLLVPAVAFGIGLQLLTSIFTVTMLVLLFFGIISVPTSMFYARDIEYFAALPIPQRTVFLSKLAIVYLGKLSITAILCLPAVIFYGIISESGLLFYVRGVLVIPFVPLIPLSICMLLGFLTGRLAFFRKHSDKLRIAMSLLLMLLIIFAQSMINASIHGSNASPEELVKNMQDVTGAAALSLQPGAWAANGAAAPGTAGALNFLLFLAISSGLALLAIAPAGKAYYRYALSSIETASRRGRAKVGKYIARPVFRAILLREWRTIARTPTYVLNCLSMAFIFPLVLAIVAIMQNTASGPGNLSVLTGFLRLSPETVMIIGGILSLGALISNTAPTLVSREGKCFNICKTYPVSMGRQIMPKIFLAECVALVSQLLMAFVLGIVLKLQTELIIYSVLLAVSVSLIFTCANALPDIIRPKLVWNSENEAVKQNLNVLIGMLLALASAILLVGIAFLLIWLLPGMTSVFALIVICAAASVLSLAGIRALADRKLSALEKN